MNILINYQIKKDGTVLIKEFQENGKTLVLFNDRIAVMSNEIDRDEEITLLSSSEVPFPIIVTKSEAEVILAKKQEPQTEIEFGERVEE